MLSDAIQDPLTLVLALLALGAMAAQLVARKHPLSQAIVRVALLLMLTAVFVRNDIVPYQLQVPTGANLPDLIHGTLKAAWWLLSAWLAVSVLRAFVIVERRPRESRLLHDILAGLIYLAAFFAIAAYALGLPVRGLFATSGVVAIILGLALQSTLNDVFSGIVLNFTRPYLPGDWIDLDGGIAGQVIEMNWRATHILTERRDLAIVPNSTIARSRIINISSPSTVHGRSVVVRLDDTVLPSEGKELIELAVLNCRAIRSHPAPSVAVKALTAGDTAFEITLFTEGINAGSQAQSDLLELIYRHAVAAGIDLARTRARQCVQLPLAAKAKDDRNRLLSLVAIFRSLMSDEREALAVKLKRNVHEVGTIVEPGRKLDALFVVGRGVLSVTHGDPAEELMRLGPGDHYGEIGMLTGEPSQVAISALVPTVVYELSKSDLAPVLAARPQVAHELSRELAHRLAMSKLAAEPQLDARLPAPQASDWFLSRLHRLFDLTTAVQ